MRQTTQHTIQAVALDHFGGLETLTLRTLPVPEVKPDHVLVRVESAGVGAWDVFEREGLFAAMYGGESTFPYVLGSEGAGRSWPSARKSAVSRRTTRCTGSLPQGTPRVGSTPSTPPCTPSTRGRSPAR